ncbi:MAG: glycoside hydrolase family 31 protein [Opitutaceae bacterium]|jgi:alpha-glucosidase (family GH31 glycosyl hydrolase)
MRSLDIPLLENEVWWGGLVNDGVRMPYGRPGAGRFERSLIPHLGNNQGTPLLVSSRGRYVWNDDPFEFEVSEDRRLRLTSHGADFHLVDTHGGLRAAFRAAAGAHFPADGRSPDPLLFSKPQYNTWMELQYDHTQAGIIAYAEAVIANGFPPGVIMVDDTWQEDYGVWRFHPGRFSDAKAMMRRLHDLGFSVMLWVCPFVSADSLLFRRLRERGLFVRDGSGEPVIRKWWNGHSAVLDGSNPDAFAWMREELHLLKRDHGVDGFKFDAGDIEYYETADRTFAPITPHGQAEAWARLGLEFALNEYRSCWKCAGLPLVQRLSDKSHAWNDRGLGSLVPNALAQGLMGYAFICPDMIGGGLQPEFADPAASIDQELFVRYAQCAALFPMMQFSFAPWRALTPENMELCRQAVALHDRMAPEIERWARHAAETGEPILRHLAYEYPDAGFESVGDQFMLGPTILVAPVLEKGAVMRIVKFPPGAWEGADGNVVNGPCEQAVPAPLGVLPWYRRLGGCA